MTDVPSNLVPTRITQLPEYQGSETTGYMPYVYGGITYKVQGYSAVIAQIDAPIDAAAAGTITLQCSQDGCTFYNFPSGAITYATTGIQAAVNVEGLVFVRYRRRGRRS